MLSKSTEKLLLTKEEIITTINIPEWDETETCIKSWNLKDLEEKNLLKGGQGTLLRNIF